MLWPIIKFALFVAIIIALALGVGLLLESDEVLRLYVAGTEFTLTPLVTLIIAAVLIGLVWVGLKALGLLVAVLKFLLGDETAVTRYFSRSRERRGYRALSQAVMRLAEGDAKGALAAANRAEKALRQPELTRLLTAQAAEMSGDSARAERTYKEMLADKDTRFVGIRGLMRQKLAEGDDGKALQLAEKALDLKPGHTETQTTLLGLQARDGNWKGARRTLAAQARSGGLPRDVYNRRDSVLAIAAAYEAMETEEPTIMDDATAQEVLRVNRKSPDLVPGAVMAARVKIDKGAKRAATKILRRAWDIAPHPELAAAFAAIEPGESPAQRRKRFAPLISHHPEHPETKVLAAELALADEDFPAARRALMPLPETDPNQRVLALMAAIERGQGAPDREIRAWLAKAVTAPRGPAWVCESCGHVELHWRPACSNCGTLDSLSWKTPPEAASAAGQVSSMMPLLMGADVESDASADATRAGAADPSPGTATGEAMSDTVGVAETAGDGGTRQDTAHPDPGATDTADTRPARAVN